MADVRLSAAAARDIAGIVAFGDETFGPASTDAYLDGLRRRLAQAAATPGRYPRVDHIRPGCRRTVYRSHAIYYLEDDAGVLIVRVLGRQNPEGSFDDPSY